MSARRISKPARKRTTTPTPDWARPITSAMRCGTSSSSVRRRPIHRRAHRRQRDREEATMTDQSMDPRNQLAADALYIVMGHIGTETPNLSTALMRGLQMHCTGDAAIMQRVVEALTTTGYGPDD